MGIIKFNKTEKDKNKEAVMQTKTVGTSAEQLEAEQTAVKAKEERQNKSTFDDGFLEEVVDGRNINTLVYRRNDRTKREIISATPLHYFKDSDGKYAVIDNTLTDKGDVIENSSNSFIVSFDKSLAGGKIFDLKKGEKAVSLYSANFSQKEKHSVSCRCELCAEDNSVTFKSSNQTEIQYKVLSDRIKENIVVNDKQDSYEYLFLMDIGGLSVEEENGSILLNDIDNGETQFIIPSPYMYDAKQVRSNAVTYEVEADDGQLIIKVIADAAFINAADRAFPVIIDPQIVFVGETYFDCLAVGNAGGSSEDDMEYGSLIVEGSNRYGTYTYQSYLTIFASKISIDRQNLISAHLKLTAMPGAKGYFLLEQRLAQPELTFEAREGEYLIDIKDKLLQGEDFVYRLDPDVYNHNDDTRIEFYTSGNNCPAIILEYLDEQGDEKEPTIKDFALIDSATGYLNLNDGTFTTAINLLDLSDLAVPLNIMHFHRVGYDDGLYGYNWRLNLNCQLKVAKEDTEKDTVYAFRDEQGDYHTFKEIYYYLDNGVKKCVDKNAITIGIDGELKYNGEKVYKHSSCNGYSLIPEINDFIDSELIEQRQDELIQLEESVKAYESTLTEYGLYNEFKDTFEQINRIDKQSYKSFIAKANTELNLPLIDFKLYIVAMSKSEVLQLQSLDANHKASEDEKIKTNLSAQISYAREQARNNLPNIKRAFNDYFAKKAKLEQLRRQTPVNFLQDSNGIFRGFNSDGNLVCLFDTYGNSVSIEYDENSCIVDIIDSNNKSVNFDYESGSLKSITDNKGRKVSFDFIKNKLSSVTLADGNTLNFKYQSNYIRSVETSNDLQVKFSISNGKITEINTISKPVIISKEVITEKNAFTKSISKLTIEYVQNELYEGFIQKETHLHYSDGSNEQYKFYRDHSLKSHIQTNNDFSSTITQYTYNNVNGKVITKGVSSNIEGQPESLIIEQYDDFNMLVSRVEDWQTIFYGTQVKTETEYFYNNSNYIIKEVTTKFIKTYSSDEKKVSMTNYFYDAQNRLVLTENYIEGEELTSGKNYEEIVYDDKGYLIKTIIWNSLDSSSKLYSERAVAENGQVLADGDEVGNVASRYDYISGTNVINSIQFSNGGRLAYGRNPLNYQATSVTHSTENGEANTTDMLYEHGLPVEVKSGGTVIDYTYNYNREIIEVKINSNAYCTFSYKDYNYDAGTGAGTFGETTQTMADGTVFKTTKSGKYDSNSGIILANESHTVNGSRILYKQYDACGRVKNVSDPAYGETRYLYSGLNGKILQIHLDRYNAQGTLYGVLSEVYSYNDYGELSQRTITGEVKQTYTFTYKNNAARDLDNIGFGGYSFKPLTDCYGRNTGKEIYAGESKVARENITYRKESDHATTMPSTVWYTNVTLPKTRLSYKYDSRGNICEVIEDGDLVVRYTYDVMNRLIREDNKKLEKTSVHIYDSNGNILSRIVYPYSLNATEYLGKTFTRYEYEYEGDRLTKSQYYESDNGVAQNYKAYNFVYNAVGSPTTYRGKAMTWQYGNRLASYKGTTYKYDGAERRIRKAGVNMDANYTYDGEGRLIYQTVGLEFIYDHTGVAGMVFNGETYFYRKDVQGNVIAILDKSGKLVVKYIYDAWGNHKVCNSAENEITDGNHIGNINPYRYRGSYGYYYDTDTGLYYLQTRYYDPEVGRFISQDSIDYADPETINGLNLYAYCGNNPVMAVDPDGTMPKLLKWLIGGLAFLGAVALTALTGGALTPLFIGMGVSIAAGGLIQGTVTAINGGSFWDGFTEGAADGALWGGIFALGGAVLRTAQIFTKGVVIGETMSRVNSAARQIGAATYKAPGKNLVKLFGKSKAFELNKALNRAWINRMKRWGVKIVDIGLDFSRTMRSPFYALEQSSVGSYWFLIKTLW